MIATHETMSYEEMKIAAGDHTCSICGSGLTVAWGGMWKNEGHILRCGNDVNHTGMTRHTRKLNAHWQQAEKEFKERHKMDTNSLMVMSESKMLERIGLAKFPQELTQVDKRLLAQVAIAYGFDPLMREVTIYQGQPYVSIDGRYRKAQETGYLDGVQTRPANKKEREEWEIPDGDYFFRAEVFVKDTSHPFVGWGRVRKIETVGGKGFTPVEKNPQRMAEKRAESQALRKAFHIPLPSQEDIGTPDVEDTVVNGDTGEILQKPVGRVFEHPVLATETTPQPASATGTAEKATEQANTQPEQKGNLTEIQKFLAWCLSHGAKTYNRSWLCEQLNLNDVAEIKDFKEAYTTIRERMRWTD